MKANRSTGLPARVALVATVVALLAACSSLLDVKDPDVVNPPDVLNADGAVAAYNGGIGDFAFANDGDNGGTEGQVLVSGVMSDEYFDSETFPTRIEYDSRAIDERNVTLNGVFFNLHKARVALEGAAGALQQYAATPNSRIGEMLALSGMTYVYFAETNCSYSTFHSLSSDRQRNGVFVFNNQPPNGTGRFSVADGEGTNGLNFRSAADPRVVAPQNGKGFDNASPLYVLQKYASATSPVRVADGIDRKSTRLNSSHLVISYAVFCLKKKKKHTEEMSASTD